MYTVKVVKKAVIKAQNEIWEDRCRIIERKSGCSNATEAWEILRDSIASNNLIFLQERKQHRHNLLAETRLEFRINNDHEIDYSDLLKEEGDISVSDVKNALGIMKNRVVKGIAIGFFKYATNFPFELLAYVFNCFIKVEELPIVWK